MNSRKSVPGIPAGLVMAGLVGIAPAVAGDHPMDRGHRWHGGSTMPFLSQLDLSDDQKSQVKAIVDDEHAKIGPLAGASMQARHALEQAIHAPVFDESAIRAAAARSAAAESDLAVERGRLASRIRGVLTADQQKKMDALHQQSLERMQERMQQHHPDWPEDPAESRTSRNRPAARSGEKRKPRSADDRGFEVLRSACRR